MEATLPTVSIIVPCYNEEAKICNLLEAVYEQTYPRQQMEVLIADGLSTDRTRDAIHSFKHSHPDLDIQIVDNAERTIPSGLNTAIRAAKGEFLVRLDAHSRPYPDYVAKCLRALQQGKGENVGGVWEIHPGGEGWIARSIATAAAHPLAVGDALYRLGGKPRPVDTVPFGAYRRAFAERIGYYNEKLLTNEDYEFNVRVREAGGMVWLDPEIRSIYYARSSLTALAKQYFRYGFWKGKMLRRYPGTLRWRQLLPPLFIASLLVLILGSIFLPSFRYIFLGEVSIYLAILITAGLIAALKKGDLSVIIGFPLAAAIMHLSWGTALLWSFLVK